MLDKKKVAAFVSAHNQPPKIPIKKPPTPKAEPVAAKENPAKKMPPPPANEESETSIEALAEEAAQAAEASSDPDVEDVLVDYDEKDTSPPKWAEDKDLWDEAVSAVGLGTDDEDRYDEPYAVVAYLYKKLGGKIGMLDEGISEENDEDEGEDVEEDGEGDLKGLVDEVAKKSKENPDPELMDKLANYDPVKDGNPPSWVTDEALWEKAKEAVDPEGVGASYDEPYAVIAHVYKKMGGKVT